MGLKEAAAYLGVTPNTIRYWIWTERLPVDRTPNEERNKWTIKLSDLLKADQIAKQSKYAGRRGKRSGSPSTTKAT